MTATTDLPLVEALLDPTTTAGEAAAYAPWYLRPWQITAAEEPQVRAILAGPPGLLRPVASLPAGDPRLVRGVPGRPGGVRVIAAKETPA